jgi:hypothetical protein
MPQPELNLHIVAPNLVGWKASVDNNPYTTINQAIPRISKMEIDIIFNDQRVTLEFGNVTQRELDEGKLSWKLRGKTIYISSK